MVQSARGAVEFNRERYAGSKTRHQAEEETKAQTVADSEEDRVCDRPGKHPQRTVLAPQQVIRKIKTAEHIQAGAGNADGCDHMMVHADDCRQRRAVVAEISAGQKLANQKHYTLLSAEYSASLEMEHKSAARRQFAGGRFLLEPNYD